MNRQLVWICALLLGCFAVAARAQEAGKGLTPEQKAGILSEFAKSVVVVEYQLKYDKGEPPRGLGYRYFSGGGRYYGGGEEIIKQERPVEVYSYLIGEKLAVSEEVPVHPRFVESIQVRFGDKRVAGKIVANAIRENAAFIELAEPLAGAVPLTFDGSLAGPYVGVMAGPGEEGVPTVKTQSFSPDVVLSKELGTYLATPQEIVVLNNDGKPVGMTMGTYLPISESWKGSPTGWKQVTAVAREAMLGIVEGKASNGLVRVTLNFRSPKQSNPLMARFGGGGDEQGPTEQHTIGVLLADGHLIVPVELKSTVTARLERVRMFLADGSMREGTFVGSLKDYGGFVTKVDDLPADAGVTLSDQPIVSYHHRLLPRATIEVRGEERLAYFGHVRITSFSEGWRKQLYPNVVDDEQDSFLFDEKGSLVAFPISKREKASVESQYSRGEGAEPVVTPAVYLRNVLADLQNNLDSSNVPLSEEEENRIAWLGVVLQPLNRELARANKVAELTRDGQTGALVNYIYPGSPAMRAGVEPGWILLRLRIEGNPQPVDVRVSEISGGIPLRWENWDNVPEQAFDQIPQPWPDADNPISQLLTQAGFGTKFTAEFFADGERISKEFVVEQSPAHYMSAKKYKHSGLGVTVKNLTYEVRTYFQMLDDDPGVILYKIEPGSKASVAGLKPLEVVTEVNGQPVADAEAFRAATEAGGELRLAIKRMTRMRQVIVTVDPAKQDAENEEEDAAN